MERIIFEQKIQEACSANDGDAVDATEWMRKEEAAAIGDIRR